MARHRTPAKRTAARGGALLIGLALAGCGRDAVPDPRGVDRDETLLTLSATGEAETVPDLAIMEVGVESFAASARAASEANARKSAAVAAVFARFGIAERDLQTRNLSVNRVEYGPKKGQYQASNVLRVRMRDAAKAGEAMAAATDAGANVMMGPQLSVSDPETANRGAYIAAYKAARTRAQAYADAAGMEIARVLAIRDGGVSAPVPPPVMMEQAADAAMAPPVAAPPPPPAFRIGTNRMRVAVQVDFALREK